MAALIGFGAARLLPVGGGRAVALLAVAVIVVVVGFAAGTTLGLATAGAPPPSGMVVVLGLATLRGAAQGDPSAGSHDVDTLVRRSPFLVGGAWALGLLMAGEGRSAFMAAAAFDSLVFVITAALALGTSRMAALPPEVRDQLGGNGAWLLMVGTVVGLALVIALPVAALLGQPIGMAATGVAAGVTTGVLGVTGAIVTAIMVVVDTVARLIPQAQDLSQIQSPPPLPPEVTPGRPLPAGGGEGSSSSVELLIAAGVIVGLVLIGWVLARRARRSAVARPGRSEARSIDLGDRPRLPGLHLPKRLRALRAPDDAEAAYQRLLADWASVAEVARDPSETPAAHAARLRAAGDGATGLDLLAADYQLVRFAGVRLSPAEERRAIGRWRRLRTRPRTRGEHRPGSGATPPDA